MWYLIQDSTLTQIADTIRAVTGTTEKITPSSFSAKVAEISANTGSSDPNIHYLTFMSEDGNTILYKRPVADGDNCADPIAKGWVETPVKESTPQYSYTYSGWASVAGGAASSSILNGVTADKTVYAAFRSNLRYYTVSYYDGETLLKTESLAYGATPAYTPVKNGYEFSGWEPAITSVTGDAAYYSQWTELEGFAVASWSEIAEVAASGLASTAYKVGDYKTVDISGYGTVEVEIVGFNQDNLADGSGKAPITLALRNVISATWSYDSVGQMSQTWATGALRSKIAGLMSNLPADLQAVIKPVKKTYRSNTGSGTTTYSTCNDSLWALSSTELGLGTMTGYTEGVTYTWYSASSTRAARITRTLYGKTTKRPYWIRTNTAWNRYWSYITADGSVTSSTSSGGYNLHFGFCI